MSDDKAPPTKLYTALLAAMKVCGPVKKNASNPAFRTKYADLQSVLDTIEGPLWDHGLLIVQRFGYDTEQAVLFTEVIHAESGERITSMIPVVSKDPHDPQKMGGAITYYRRYSLLALLGLAPEDDDGNAASKPPQRQQEQPPRPPANAYSASNMYSPTPPAAPAPSGPQQLAPNQVRIPCAECHHAGTCRTEGYCQVAAVAQSKQPRPMNKPEFEHLIEDIWTLVENGKPYADIVAKLQTKRERMSDEQYEITKAELPKIKQAIAERAAPAIAG